MRRLQEEAGPDWLHLQVFWLILAATKKQPTFEVKSYFSLSQLLSLNLCLRCGGLFCSIHRYSDKHQCDFDYKVTPETPAQLSCLCQWSLHRSTCSHLGVSLLAAEFLGHSNSCFTLLGPRRWGDHQKQPCGGCSEGGQDLTTCRLDPAPLVSLQNVLISVWIDY